MSEREQSPYRLTEEDANNQRGSREGNAPPTQKPIIDVDVNEEDQEEEELNVENAKRKNPCARFLEFIIPPGGMFASAFTLGSSTLGAGILGLPFAFHSMGIAVALVILLCVDCFSIFSLWLLAHAADLTGMRTYEDCMTVLTTKGTGYFVACCMIGFTIGGGCSYIITMGNLLTPIFDDDSVPHFLRTTVGNRVIVTCLFLVFILPMCLPKHIDSLRHTSAIGVMAVIFFVICVIENSCEYMSDHGWRSDIHALNTGNAAISSLGTIIFTCMVQMNAFEVYHEMEHPTPAFCVRNSILALAGCGTLYVLCGFFGYARFGSSIESSILLMYQPRENKVFWVSYIGILFKICVAFALHQLPMRDGIYHFLRWDVYKMSWTRNALQSGGFAILVLILGLFIPNITIVFGIAGSICGGFLGYIFPAYATMYSGNWNVHTVGFVLWAATYLLLLAGVIAVAFGTVSAVYDIALLIKNDE